MAATDPNASSNTSSLASLASLAPLIINMLKGTSQPNPGALIGTIPGGQDLVNSVVGQQQQQAPLRQAVTQQAMNMLPNSAFPGGRPALAPVGAGAAPVASSGGGTDWGKILAAAGIGAGAGALGANSGNNLGKILEMLKNAFSSSPSLQRNKPNPGGALTGGGQTPPGFNGWADPSGGSPSPLISDPGVWYGEGGGGAQPTDPSGGTGVGPGMQGYYDGGGSPGGDGSEE